MRTRLSGDIQRTTIFADAIKWRRARQLALAEGVTVGAVIRNAIDDFIRKAERRAARKESQQIGVAGSGAVRCETRAATS